MFTESPQRLFDHVHNVCVVGSGPVGIVVALELARLGQSVTIIESGVLAQSIAAQQLSDAIVVDPDRHADMSLAVQRRFGGTSNLWGAGCVPLDPIDFQTRPHIPCSGWPIPYQEYVSFLSSACHYANCGAPHFEEAILDLDIKNTHFRIDQIIRYSDPPSFRRAYASALRSSDKIGVYTDATAVGINFADDGRVRGLLVKGRSGYTGILRARAFVIACGGIETARLLLVAQTESPNRFGGRNGPLGRYYMGHLSGQLANIHLHSSALDQALDFHKANGESYARRRFAASEALQMREHLSNVSFWPIQPPFYDHRHRSGVLSLAYLALSFPPVGRLLVSELLRQVNAPASTAKLPHIMNIVRELPGVANFLPQFLYGRFLSKTRLPGLHIRNKGRRYALHYHAEHLPNPESRIWLSDKTDSLGMPRAVIDIRFSDKDAGLIVRIHEFLANWLSETNLGSLTWRVSLDDRVQHVLQNARDGVHQIGTTRMSETDRTGVVDGNCCVFGSRNLFIAGSAVFPTSGQANPTLSAIALGVRLAQHLAPQVSQHDLDGLLATGDSRSYRRG